MQLYPALDLRGGRVARAAHGGDPVNLLAAWRAAGATWAHVVDMDRATGTGDNTPLLETLLTTRAGLRMQVGGGLRRADAERVLALGAERAVVGSANVHELRDLVTQEGAARVGFALDLRDGHAWSPDGHRVGEAHALFTQACAAGARVVILRDLTRDGTLAGAATALLSSFRRDGVELVLAGGVASVADLHAARSAGAAGVIVGRALLDGRLTIEEALACCG